jgi:MFS family permease
VLITKGVAPSGIGWALALLFAGGAVGKFLCGVLAERLGVIRTVVITEAFTAIGILTVLAAPLQLALVVLVPLGVALNGTSSVLYGTVADLVTSEGRSRSYGLYYTLTIGASAVSPTIYGALGDAVGVPITLTVISLMVLVTIPLCSALRPAVTATHAAARA